MKQINITIDDKPYRKIRVLKNKLKKNWRDFLIELVDNYKP